jgi:replication initiation and membrane attachment protein DnaB
LKAIEKINKKYIVARKENWKRKIVKVNHATATSFPADLHLR